MQALEFIRLSHLHEFIGHHPHPHSGQPPGPTSEDSNPPPTSSAVPIGSYAAGAEGAALDSHKGRSLLINLKVSRKAVQWTNDYVSLSKLETGYPDLET